MHSVSNILADHLCRGLPIHPPPSFRQQQHRCFTLSLRGPPYGRLLGNRSFTSTSNCSHSHGALPTHGGVRLRQDLALLPQRDQHDVRWWPGDRHRRRTLQSPPQGRAVCDTTRRL